MKSSNLLLTSASLMMMLWSCLKSPLPQNQNSQESKDGSMDSNVIGIKPATAAVNTPMNLTNYNLNWQEDFGSNTLDMSNWNYRDLNSVRGMATVKQENVSIYNGILSIAANKVNGNYTVGQISTQNSHSWQYGYFECYAEVNTKLGPHCSLWLQSTDQGKTDNNPAANGVEIDIFEYHRNGPVDLVRHNLHWNGYTTGITQSWGTTETVSGVSSGYHKFGLEWTPNQYIFYVDGVEKQRTSTAVSQHPEYIILTMEITGYGGDPSNTIFPDYFNVDYVKVYQPIFDPAASYKIVNVNSGLCLDVTGASNAAGATIQQQTYTGATDQLWKIIPSSNGYYRIVNVKSGLSLDVNGASTALSSPLVQNPVNADATLIASNQEWYFANPGTNTYTVVNRNSNLAVDVPQNSTVPGRAIDQYTVNTGTNKQWVFTKIP